MRSGTLVRMSKFLATLPERVLVFDGAFGTWVQKSMYGRKYMGMERATYLISADGRVLKAWRKVKVPNHAEEVLKAGRELA